MGEVCFVGLMGLTLPFPPSHPSRSLAVEVGLLPSLSLHLPFSTILLPSLPLEIGPL